MVIPVIYVLVVLMLSCTGEKGTDSRSREAKELESFSRDEAEEDDFEKKYADDIRNQNKQLDGNSLDEITVVVDSGHGGIDPGKTSAGGVLEKDINLAIAFELKKELEDNGIKVIMTRESDEGLYDKSDKNKKAVDLKKRCAIINESGAKLAISVHQNSYTDKNVSGAQVFYYKKSEQGKIFAEFIQESLKNNLDSSNNRVAKYDNTYYILLHTQIPVVIAECGFLSNDEEAAKLSDKEYQNRVANALCLGILEYIKKS